MDSDVDWKANHSSKLLHVLTVEGGESAEGGLVKSRGMRRRSVAPASVASAYNKATGAHAHGGHVASLALSEMVNFSAPVYLIKFESGGRRPCCLGRPC